MGARGRDRAGSSGTACRSGVALSAAACVLVLTSCSSPGPASSPVAVSASLAAPSSATATASPGASPPPTGAALTTQLKELVRTMGGVMNNFSGAILITRGNQVLLAQASGLADEKHGTPVRLTTRFDIASLTKQFTAMAILMLEHRGKLRLSDRICRYVAHCPAAWAPVTLTELLTHTAGIPEYIGPPPATYVDHNLALFRNLPLTFTPGTAWGYSNDGYILLGVVVEKVSGMTYEAFLQKNIFGPLRMRNTGYDHGHQGVAVGYASAGQLADEGDMRFFFSAGSLYSTVEDLHLWERALAVGTLVPQSVVAEMEQPRVKIGNDPDHQYGYGVFVDEVGDPNHPTREIEHPGQLTGFINLLAHFPASGLDIVILSNHGDTVYDGVDEKIRQLVLGGP